MKTNATTKALRDGESAVCDCCGAELTARVVVTAAGNFGQDCWKTIRSGALFARDAIRFPAAYGALEETLAKVDAMGNAAKFVRMFAEVTR